MEFLHDSHLQLTDDVLLRAIADENIDEAYERIKQLKDERTRGEGATGDHFFSSILLAGIEAIIKSGS